MTDNPPTLHQLLHEFTADYALLDEPLEFTYTEWSHGTPELARCVVTGLTVRQFKGRLVQTLKCEWADPSPRVLSRKHAGDGRCAQIRPADVEVVGDDD